MTLIKNKIITLGAIGVLAVGGFSLIPDTQSAPLLSNEDAKAQNLMLVVTDKNGDIIPDFQSNAKLGDLKANAERAGKTNVQEKWVTQEEYKTAENAFIASVKPQRDAEKAQKQAQLTTLAAKARATWTDQELVQLEDLILAGLRFENNPQR